MNNLKDYIVVVKNVLPIELCNEIIAEYKNSDKWEIAQIMNEKKDIRKCEILGLSLNENKTNQKKIDIDKFVFNSVGIAIASYGNKFNFLNVSQDTGYDLLRYETGGYYQEHVDGSIENIRTLSCSIILNEDYEGGEFAFFNNSVRYKLNAGDAILFPSNFMYPHEILPVKKGIRYSIITWLN